MFTRTLVPTLVLAALAGSASAGITFTTSANASYKFTLPTGVTLSATTSQVKDTLNTGVGTSTSDVTFGGDGMTLFTLGTSASGSVFGMGSATSTATGGYQFKLTNGTNKKATVKIHFTYDLSATLAGTGSLDDFTDSSNSATGLVTGGSDSVFADAFNRMDSSSGEYDFVLDLNKNSVQSFGYTSSSDGSVQAVPEPASLAALGTGVIGLLRRRRK